jgi:hypothetical protein
MLPYGQLFSLHSVLDEDRRPLGEHRAPSELSGTAPTQLRSCPYPGSRHEHRLPMNLSALRQATRNWDELLTGLAALRDWCGGGAQPSSLAELWQLTAAAAALPAYLLHRPGKVRVLDGATASLYKACLGLKFLIEQRVVQEALAGRGADLGADGLNEFSESSGWLVGRQEVCAAPPGLIRDVLDVAVHGLATRGRSRLVDDVDAPAQLRAFVDASWRLYGVLLLYSIWSARRCEQEHGSGSVAVHDPPRQNQLSLTLGMSRIVSAACDADDAACAALLDAFCALASPPGERDALAAARRAFADARDSSRGEEVAATGVRELELRLNEALGLTSGELGLPDLSAYRAQPRSDR